MSTNKNDYYSKDIIKISIVFTIIFQSILFSIYYGIFFSEEATFKSIQQDVPRPFLSFLIILILYPFIGKLISDTCRILWIGVRKTYEIEKTEKFPWGDWKRDDRLICASIWPLIIATILPWGLISFLYGILFKKLF